MSAANRATSPGEAAVRERVEVVFEAIDAMTPDQLRGVAMRQRDTSERDRLVRRLERAVATAGRDALLGEARTAVRRSLDKRLATVQPDGGFEYTTHTGGRVDERVAMVAAVDDAVAVAVAEDLLASADARTLSDPGRALLGLPSLGDEPRGAPATKGPVWEPSETDWADAQRAAGADVDAPKPGPRGMRAVVFGAIALIGIPAAIAVGLANGQPLIGVLVAIAIGALCWTFATFRRAG